MIKNNQFIFSNAETILKARDMILLLEILEETSVNHFAPNYFAFLSLKNGLEFYDMMVEIYPLYRP